MLRERFAETIPPASQLPWPAMRRAGPGWWTTLLSSPGSPPDQARPGQAAEDTAAGTRPPSPRGLPLLPSLPPLRVSSPRVLHGMTANCPVKPAPHHSWPVTFSPFPPQVDNGPCKVPREHPTPARGPQECFQQTSNRAARRPEPRAGTWRAGGRPALSSGRGGGLGPRQGQRDTGRKGHRRRRSPGAPGQDRADHRRVAEWAAPVTPSAPAHPVHRDAPSAPWWQGHRILGGSTQQGPRARHRGQPRRPRRDLRAEREPCRQAGGPGACRRERNGGNGRFREGEQPGAEGGRRWGAGSPGNDRAGACGETRRSRHPGPQAPGQPSPPLAANRTSGPVPGPSPPDCAPARTSRCSQRAGSCLAPLGSGPRPGGSRRPHALRLICIPRHSGLSFASIVPQR